MPLENEKHERFCQEYLVDLNATQAAIRTGYSVKTARAQGSRLLTKADIKARIVDIIGKQIKKTEITREWVMGEMARIARFDPRKMFGSDGKMLSIPELDDDTAAAISSFEMDVAVIKDEKPAEGEPVKPAEFHEYVKKIRVTDKKGALDSLAKILGMFVDKVEHTGKDGAPIETKDMSDMEAARRVAFLLASAQNKLEEKK